MTTNADVAALVANAIDGAEFLERAMITIAGGIDALPDEDMRHKARVLLGDDS
jgi:hypothetical protein